MMTIVFIHKGNSWYLPYTLWQCRMTNPSANIYLIGDKNSRHLIWDGIMHVNIDDYAQSIQLLDKVYRHKSNLGASFELACIERWFILAAFLQQKKIDRCVYLDSDILVYEDLSKYPALFSGYDMTWCSFSAHVNFVMSIAALENYCTLVTDLFQGKANQDFMEQSLYCKIFHNESELNISDMSFFYDYNEFYPHSLLAINVPKPGISCFDISMEDIGIFKSDGQGFKAIKWENNKPLTFLKKTDATVPMAILHFQGKAKPLIPMFFRFGSLRFWLFKLRNEFYLKKMLFTNKIHRKLKKTNSSKE